jgi:hypothetical protein
MSNRGLLTVLFLSPVIAYAQNGRTPVTPSALPAQTTFPIVFTKTISADHSHVGDIVTARTIQSVALANGTSIPSGAQILGHVIAATPFIYDKTPYAHQKPSELSIRFDALQVNTMQLPLNITVRAMADPIASWNARIPNVNGEDSSIHAVTQIGGDQLTSSQAEVVSMQGDVVAYNRHGSVYAHLIANGGCDASAVEVSVGIYSASACGLYGFTNVTGQEAGSEANPSAFTLVSTRTAPKVWKNSTALLEVLPSAQSSGAR